MMEPLGDYPRDLIGYGAQPPHANWPGKARIALQFVLNYEEGAENCILHGDAASEAFLSEMVAAQPIPGMRHMSMESIYEYGQHLRTGSAFCVQHIEGILEVGEELIAAVEPLW